MPITYVTADGREVAGLVDRVEDAVEGHPNVTVTISCLAVAIMAQNPDVKPDKLQTMVKYMSEYIAASLFDESPSGAAN